MAKLKKGIVKTNKLIQSEDDQSKPDRHKSRKTAESKNQVISLVSSDDDDTKSRKLIAKKQ